VNRTGVVQPLQQCGDRDRSQRPRDRHREEELDERERGRADDYFCAAAARSVVTVMSGFSFRKLFSPMPLTFIKSSN
jgi:hypothetical protein